MGHRLGVDGRWMIGAHRGMGHFARALLSQYPGNPTVLLPRGTKTSEWPYVARGSGFFPYWEQWVLPRLCRKIGITHLLCPYNSGPVRIPSWTRVILVVHDLIFMEPAKSLPRSHSMYQNLGRLYRASVVPWAVRRADVLVTVSEFSKHEIGGRLRIPLDRIIVIPNSLPDAWFVQRPTPPEGRLPYLLTVSGEAPSKNLSGLLLAFSAMRDTAAARGIDLRIVGVKPTHHERVRRLAGELGILDRVRLEGFVREEELRGLYQRAQALVLPSLFEGFGIPVLEAMASGTPVACSNTTSLPEIVGEGGVLFDPRDTESIAEALTALLSDAQLRTRLAVAGLARAERFGRRRVQDSMRVLWSRVLA